MRAKTQQHWSRKRWYVCPIVSICSSAGVGNGRRSNEERVSLEKLSSYCPVLGSEGGLSKSE